jgi:hypothetical protein
MSDYVSFGPSDGRARRELSEAFARKEHHAPAVVESVESPPDRRRPHEWSRPRVVAALVAAASVVAAIAISLGPGAERRHPPSPPLSAAPAAADGWRWDAYRGVRVLVPSNWAYALEPGGDWCRRDIGFLPQHPYVSLGARGQSVGGAGCHNANGDLAVQPPTRLWTAHVALDRAAEAAGTRTTRKNGWWVVRRSVGDVIVKAVSHDRTIAGRIAESAEIVGD